MEIKVDFAELELRAQAMLKDQKDVHTETAAKMFGVPESEVTPTMRQKGKQRNFFEMYQPLPPIGNEK